RPWRSTLTNCARPAAVSLPGGWIPAWPLRVPSAARRACRSSTARRDRTRSGMPCPAALADWTRRCTSLWARPCTHWISNVRNDEELRPTADPILRGLPPPVRAVLPPPLWGRAGEGGMAEHFLSGLPPPLSPPHHVEDMPPAWGEGNPGSERGAGAP